MPNTRTITARALGVLLLAGAALAAPVLLTAPAEATACSGSISAGTSCTDTGTLTLTGGALSAIPPTSLGWTGSLAGADQEIVDSTTADQSIEVDDLTGSGAGWHLTAAATTFSTGSTATDHQLADTGTLKINGSLTDDTAATAPTGGCASGTASDCTAATTSTTFPVALTTAATTPAGTTIYAAAKDSGLGKIKVGNLGWWIHVPANAYAGTYTSTITFSVISAP